MSDLINREDVLALAKDIVVPTTDGEYRHRCIDPQEVIELPPAQPQRMHGKWIRHEYADIVDGYYVPKFECDQCHAWKNDDSTFCPECGADMREESNETD